MDSVLFWVLLLSACVGLSSACSCFPEQGPERFCKYDIIVRGTAMAEYKELEEPLDHSDPYPEFNSFADWVYAVKVDRAIVMPRNMTTAKTVKIRTSTQDNLCGSRFALDIDYVFFASFNYDGEVETGLCDPNTPWDSLTEWDQELITDHIVDFCTNRDKPVTPPEP
ncbi:metalloproteinase inhibitor 3-like [Littorina saxatilis]|uniref:Tissue inhibitor of metalloproteinase n=1 Tax=Littorina saxatilis TaxID=31220 RepID=A0AAN9B1Y9_9CAEN